MATKTRSTVRRTARPAPPPSVAPAGETDQDRAARLEAELAELRATLAEDQEDEPVPDTHIVFLANGDTFRTNAPVMTRHHVEGIGPVKVVGFQELTGEEE